MENNNEDICSNCDGRRGLHNYHNQRCPKDINSNADNTEYRNTIFKPIKTQCTGDRDCEELKKELEQLKAESKLAFKEQSDDRVMCIRAQQLALQYQDMLHEIIRLKKAASSTEELFPLLQYISKLPMY